MKEIKRYTLITGASSGIGYALAKTFAKMKKNLIIVARNKEKLAKLKDDIQEKYPDLDVVIKASDLSIIENVYNLYDELKPFFIETWINNAGFGNYSSVSKQNIKKIEAMLNLNVEALALFSTLYVHDYENKEGTQLINISSCGGYIIVPTAVTYCATKFFVSTFTEGLAKELKTNNAKLKAKVLAPAATKTNFGNTANNVNNYDYDKSFGKYHTSQQIADFLVKLYNSNKIIGSVNRDTFDFELKDSFFDYADSSKSNQKI